MGSLERKQTSLKDFKIINELGEGAFSVVYKVTRISDGESYALKKVKIRSLKKKEKENALNEIRILASIDNPYVVAYKEAFINSLDGDLCIVMEFLGGGDLYHKIKECRKKRALLPEPLVWRYFGQMVQGLKSLHDMGIIHRDLKCANVFISQDMKQVKLGDLNVSKVTQDNMAQTQTGTPYYASPEVWRDETYDDKADIWSLGCILYEMCTRRTPFVAKNMEELFKVVQKGTFDRISSKYYSQELQEMIDKCLNVTPRLRPSCDEMLRDPLLKSRISLKMAAIPEKKGQLLIEQIDVPSNLKDLNTQFPKPQYNMVRSQSARVRRPNNSDPELGSDFKSKKGNIFGEYYSKHMKRKASHGDVKSRELNVVVDREQNSCKEGPDSGKVGLSSKDSSLNIRIENQKILKEKKLNLGKISEQIDSEFQKRRNLEASGLKEDSLKLMNRIKKMQKIIKRKPRDSKRSTKDGTQSKSKFKVSGSKMKSQRSGQTQGQSHGQVAEVQGQGSSSKKKKKRGLNGGYSLLNSGKKRSRGTANRERREREQTPVADFQTRNGGAGPSGNSGLVIGGSKRVMDAYDPYKYQMMSKRNSRAHVNSSDNLNASSNIQDSKNRGAGHKRSTKRVQRTTREKNSLLGKSQIGGGVTAQGDHHQAPKNYSLRYGVSTQNIRSPRLLSKDMVKSRNLSRNRKRSSSRGGGHPNPHTNSQIQNQNHSQGVGLNDSHKYIVSGKTAIKRESLIRSQLKRENLLHKGKDVLRRPSLQKRNGSRDLRHPSSSRDGGSSSKRGRQVPAGMVRSQAQAADLKVQRSQRSSFKLKQSTKNTKILEQSDEKFFRKIEKQIKKNTSNNNNSQHNSSLNLRNDNSRSRKRKLISSPSSTRNNRKINSSQSNAYISQLNQHHDSLYQMMGRVPKGVNGGSGIHGQHDSSGRLKYSSSQRASSLLKNSHYNPLMMSGRKIHNHPKVLENPFGKGGRRRGEIGESMVEQRSAYNIELDSSLADRHNRSIAQHQLGRSEERTGVQRPREIYKKYFRQRSSKDMNSGRRSGTPGRKNQELGHQVSQQNDSSNQIYLPDSMKGSRNGHGIYQSYQSQQSQQQQSQSQQYNLQQQQQKNSLYQSTTNSHTNSIQNLKMRNNSKKKRNRKAGDNYENHYSIQSSARKPNSKMMMNQLLIMSSEAPSLYNKQGSMSGRGRDLMMHGSGSNKEFNSHRDLNLGAPSQSSRQLKAPTSPKNAHYSYGGLINPMYKKVKGGQGHQPGTGGAGGGVSLAHCANVSSSKDLKRLSNRIEYMNQQSQYGLGGLTGGSSSNHQLMRGSNPKQSPTSTTNHYSSQQEIDVATKRKQMSSSLAANGLKSHRGMGPLKNLVQNLHGVQSLDKMKNMPPEGAENNGAIGNSYWN